MASPSGLSSFQILQEEELRRREAGASNFAGPSTQRPRKSASKDKKAIAACSGAVVTSLTMTPFDVIKTRLQTQANPEPLFAPNNHLPRTAVASSSRGGASASSTSAAAPRMAQASAHPATCCQATFFTANKEGPGLLCVHDPRIEAAALKGSTASAGAGSSAATGAALAAEPHSRASPSGSASQGKGGIPSSSSSGAARIRPFPSSSAISHVSTFHPPVSLSPAVAYAYPHYAPTPPSASTMSAVCAFPDRGVAARELERAAGDKRLTGMLDGFVKVWRLEGARGLWRGLSPTLMMTIPSQVTYMTCYDHFRALFLSWEDTPARPASAPATPQQPSLQAVTAHSLIASLVAGGLSRTISATLVTPLELLRTRLQATESSAAGSNLRTLLSGLAREVRSDGPTVLFRGLTPTLWRDVPFSAIYFMGYESLKRILTGGGLGEGNAKGGAEEFAVAFVGGAVSGTVAAIATHPADLVKTRLQATMAAAGDGGSSSGRSQPSSRLSATLRLSSRPSTSSGMLAAFRNIVADEGVKGLFRGLSPRVAKVAPACGIMIGSFEVVGRMLAEGDD